jgi:hypothetical protein
MENTKNSVSESIMTQIRYVLLEAYVPTNIIFHIFSYLDIISFFRLFGVSKGFYSFIQQMAKVPLPTGPQLTHGSLFFCRVPDSNGLEGLVVYILRNETIPQLKTMNMDGEFDNSKSKDIVQIRSPSVEHLLDPRLINNPHEYKRETYHGICGVSIWKYLYDVHIKDFIIMNKISALFSERIFMNLHFVEKLKSLLMIPICNVTLNSGEIIMNAILHV